MNTPTITAERMACIKKRVRLALACAAIACAFASEARAEWKIDLSRRQKSAREADLMAAGSDRGPASAGASVDSVAAQAKGAVESLFEAGEPTQELVLLSTDRGFVPNSLRLRKGSRYLVHVVNVNEKEKNVSFVLDAFGEHHATYYGKIKSFRVDPKKEGIFSFQCPETSAEGRVVVFAPGGTNAVGPGNGMGGAAPAPTLRAPSSLGFPVETTSGSGYEERSQP